MDKQESLQDKLNKIFNKIAKIPDEIIGAVEEGLKDSSNLVCVEDGLLNFERIEEDVERIHRDMKDRGDKVIGSHLILDDERDFMEIRTYTARGDKTFVIKVDAEVKRVINIPSDILEELQKEGRVKINLKF